MNLACPDSDNTGHWLRCLTHNVSRLPRAVNEGSGDQLRYEYYCHFCEHPERAIQVGAEASAAVATGPAGESKTARRSRQRAGRALS